MRNIFGNATIAGVAIMVVLAACSSSSGPTGAQGGTDASADTSTTDASTMDASTMDAPVETTDASADTSTADAALDSGGACTALAAPTCNTLAMPAQATDVTDTVGMPPTVTGGGTVPDGTYILTASMISSGTPGTRKSVLVGTGTCSQGLEVTAAGETRSTSTSSYTSGGSFTSDFICPIVLSVPGSFRVDAIAGGKVKLVTLVNIAGKATYREFTQL